MAKHRSAETLQYWKNTKWGDSDSLWGDPSMLDEKVAAKGEVKGWMCAH